MTATSVPALQQLRDIHLPAPVGWWPPAPGWWLLLTLLIATLLIAFFWIKKYRQRNRYRRLALQQLHALRTQPHDNFSLPQAVNRLLKQTALAAYPRQRVAALNGADWLLFLDSGLKQPRFSEPTLRALTTTYQTEPETVAPEVLLNAAEYWIRRHRC
jgi:hypothetical protein